ncbi:MAG: hypothetical protein KAH17_05780, partial [Bacteroidales bacterium]|nr:hypothetical protein [Bacteroidales bacterium]
MKKQILILLLLVISGSLFSQPFRREYITAKYMLSGSYLQFPNTGVGTISRPEADTGEDAKSLALMGGWTAETGYKGGNIFIGAGDGPLENGNVFLYGGWNLGPGTLGAVYLGTDMVGSFS